VESASQLSNGGDGCSPHHFQVYHRLATILLGLVTLANQDNHDTTTTALVSRRVQLLQQTRGLAQRILKEGRMKGGYGATQYYCWFTAIAGECSEALGDTVCANLAYKSIAKLESLLLLFPPNDGMMDRGSEDGKNTIYCRHYFVYGSHTGRGGGNKHTNDMTTLDENEVNDNVGRFVLKGMGQPTFGRNRYHFAMPPRSDNTNNEWFGDDSLIVVAGPPIVGAGVPPTLPNHHGYNSNQKNVTTTTTTDTTICTDSKIGNGLVPHGTLMERIRRTGSTDTLVSSSCRNDDDENDIPILNQH
jgi:hypothetical protein